MPPESAKLLTDILDAVVHIEAYTRGKTLDDYLQDKQLRDSVQWNFAIIGEALAQLHRIDRLVAERITEWNRIIAFRNQLIHGYGVVKNEITWDIIATKVHVLHRDVNTLLSEG